MDAPPAADRPQRLNLQRILAARHPNAKVKRVSSKMPTGGRVRVIAMNPPFSEGRWQAHLKQAGGIVDKFIHASPDFS